VKKTEEKTHQPWTGDQLLLRCHEATSIAIAACCGSVPQDHGTSTEKVPAKSTYDDAETANARKDVGAECRHDMRPSV